MSAPINTKAAPASAKTASAAPANSIAAPAGPSIPQPEPRRMPIFSTSGAMSLLWHKAASQMNLQELEWVADGAARQTRSAADSLTDVLTGIGCLVQADDGDVGSFVECDSSAALIFNIRNQIDAIAGLADLAADASYRVRLALKGQP